MFMPRSFVFACPCLSECLALSSTMTTVALASVEDPAKTSLACKFKVHLLSVIKRVAAHCLFEHFVLGPFALRFLPMQQLCVTSGAGAD